MLKLKLQYFDHLMRRTDSLEKILILGKIERRWRRGWQRMSWLNGITNLMDMNLSGPQELVMDREAWHAAANWSQSVGHDWGTELTDWIDVSLQFSDLTGWMCARWNLISCSFAPKPLVSHLFQNIILNKIIYYHRCLIVLCIEISLRM